ncbi:MAG: hypothetical protein LJE61_09185 [Thiocapsa sp.]|jgi:hypothetical protein|nr:hypothetical protein [Thiocapsa sp.]MCG6898032.1 hypothetical protein [Thiocapsa sp.]MCG6985354.1 hypothetical protein [Thiocapsa sp.]
MKTIVPLFVLVCTTSAPLIAADVRDIEIRRLFEPTPAELRQEGAGRIYIYEGLTEADIARAMDSEFERVESMMFIRIPVTDGQGEVVKDPDTGQTQYYDDGC